APLEPALDESIDCVVELLARDSPEDGSGDGCAWPKPAPQENVVGLTPLALVVAGRGALKSDVADPVLPACVRAAVEVQPQIGDGVAEARLEVLDQLVQPGLRLGDREVAVRLAGAPDRGSPYVVDVERETEGGQLGDGGADLGLGDVCEYEVLL